MYRNTTEWGILGRKARADMNGEDTSGVSGQARHEQSECTDREKTNEVSGRERII